MRTFGNDAPQFFAFQLEGEKTVYKIPLAASMNNREVRAFESTNGDYVKQIDWLRTYLGDVVDDLTPATTGEILRAWSEESKNQGAEPGES